MGVLQIELMAAQYDARTAAEALTSAQEQVSDLTWHLEDSHGRLAELEASCSEAVIAQEAAEQRAAELEDHVALFTILAASTHEVAIIVFTANNEQHRCIINASLHVFSSHCCGSAQDAFIERTPFLLALLKGFSSKASQSPSLLQPAVMKSNIVHSITHASECACAF